MTEAVEAAPIRRVVGVALNAAIDKTVSVDRLVAGSIHRPVVRSVVAGGKAANVVRAARHLGLDGAMVAVLGGHAGAWYRAQLEERSIALHEVVVADETRTCLSVLDESTGELTEFYEAGVRLGTRTGGASRRRVRAAIGGDGRGVVVVLAGSLPPGTPVDGYARLAAIAAEAGARAVVDSDGDVAGRGPRGRTLAGEGQRGRGRDRHRDERADQRIAPSPPPPSSGHAAPGSPSSPAASTARRSRRPTARGRSATCRQRSAGPTRSAAGTRSSPGSSPGCRGDCRLADALRLAGAAGAANAQVAGPGRARPGRRRPDRVGGSAW